MNTNADLLKELRIDRKAAPPPSRKGLWVTLAILLALALLALAGWWLLGRDQAIPV